MEHDKVWFDGTTPFRTLMYHHSKLINRLNSAEQKNSHISDKVRSHAQGLK